MEPVNPYYFHYHEPTPNQAERENYSQAPHTDQVVFVKEEGTHTINNSLEERVHPLPIYCPASSDHQGLVEKLELKTPVDVDSFSEGCNLNEGNVDTGSQFSGENWDEHQNEDYLSSPNILEEEDSSRDDCGDKTTMEEKLEGPCKGKRFHCSSCNYKTNFMSNLRSHELNHSGC